MKGVILAGGKNTRLRPLTDSIPKALVGIGERTMIGNAVKYFLDADIKDITALVAPGIVISIHGVSVINDRGHYGVVTALWDAKKYLDGDEIIVINGDFVCERNPVDQVIQMESPAVLWDTIEDEGNYGVMTGDVIVERWWEGYKGEKGVLGVFYYPDGVFDVINKLSTSWEKQLTLSDVNTFYAKQGILSAQRIRGRWTDAGTHEGLERAREICAS